MPFTNFPGGVASAGFPLFPGSLYDVPQGRVWFVNNNRTQALQASGDGTTRDTAFVSIADAVAKIATTNPTLGDIILVGAGHTENVTASNVFGNSLVNTSAVTIPAGTRIIGEGIGIQRPLLTFTAAASTITLANAACSLENMQFQSAQSGTITNAAIVTVTGGSCAVRAVDFNLGKDANNFATTGITLASTAVDFRLMDCDNVYAASTSPVVSFVQFTTTAAPARGKVQRNFAVLTLSSATGGCVDASGGSGTAPLGWRITDNDFINLATNSTVALKGVSGCTGMVAYNNLGITNATGGATAINTPGNWTMSQNFGAVSGKQGIAITPTSG